jgi:hypothetical protein
MARRARPSLERGLVHLAPAKLDLVAASDRAGETRRDCATCDAHCCRVGFNSMLVSRIEAAAMARRLREPDLVDRVEEIRDRARREIDRRGLVVDPFAKFDCPLLSEAGRCLVHGPAQPAGCLTFMPVADGGCDHDLEGFDRAQPRIEAAERKAFGSVEDPRPIPVALLRALAE